MRRQTIRLCLTALALAAMTRVLRRMIRCRRALPAPWRRWPRRRRSPTTSASSRNTRPRATPMRPRRAPIGASIADKRRGRNAKRRERQPVMLDDYVLNQPPVYAGPRRPANPQGQPEPEATPRPPKIIPVVADLLKAASDYFQWAPQRPATEGDFKRAYARFADPRGIDARAGGPDLRVRDRRQRQLRHAVGPQLVAARGARDLDRDRLQPAPHHQQRRADRRAGRRCS